ncbi:MAG: hypothetical protein HY907_08905 [Deltaproteobacteria bacterium]|nr:hypothetical protein [Deltaproteobacteria bacterium]
MNVRTISVLCLVATMGWAGGARAAVGGPDRFGYGWKDSDEAGVTYSWDDVGTTACVTLNDDAESAAVPIGFTFNFYGTDYTTARIGSNGYVSFQSNPITSFVGQCPLPMNLTGSTQTVNLAVYGFFNDLDPNASASGPSSICYATLGTAGVDQRFVVSWENIDYYQGSPAWGSDPVTFQIVLYEGTNEAQVNIQESGTHAGLPRWDDNTTLGIENIDGTQGLSLCGWSTGLPIPDSYAVRFVASDSFGILPGSQSAAAAPGGTASFDFEMLNFSGSSVTVALATSGTAGWTATPTPGSVTVAADGGATSFSVDVTVPAAAGPGDMGTITVTGTSGPDSTTASITLYATHGDSDWQGAADLPAAMQNLTLLADGEFLYSITGETIDDSSGSPIRVLSNKASRWDPTINGWDDCAVADLPISVTLGGACVMDGHIYYVGGLTSLADADAGTPAFFLEDLLDYDIATDTWTALTGPTYAVMSPVVACDATTGTVFVYGGYVDVNQNFEAEIPSDTEPDLGDTTVALFQSYDVASDTWTDSDSDPAALALINPDYGFTSAPVAIFGREMVLTSGSFQQQDETTGAWGGYITRSTNIYDIDANTWSEGPMLPSFVSSRAGVVFRDQLCVVGGLTSDDAGALIIIQDWWCLDGDAWVLQTDPIPDAIYSYGAATLGDFVYTAGGTDDTNALVATTQRWPSDTSLPAAADPVICAADGDADADGDVGADADADGTGDVAADADADGASDVRPDTTGDGTTDTAADGGGGGGDDGCGCSVARPAGVGSLVSLLLALGAAFVIRRRNS